MIKCCYLISFKCLILVNSNQKAKKAAKNPAGKKANGKNKKNAAPKKGKRKRQTIITSMFSVHRDQLPAGAFDRLNRA